MPDAVFVAALDMNGAEPLYLQVARHISSLIGKDSRFVDRLPSEAELCRLYAVSRITIRQALASLAERDIVVRQHGRGTFVGSLHRPGRQKTIHSFFDILSSKGLRPEMIMLDYQMRLPPQEVAKAFESVEQALFIRRGYRSEHTPLGVTEVFYPGHLASAITREMASARTSTAILREELGLRVTHADISIGLSRASEDVAQWMKLPEQTTLMRIERITTCAELGVCEYSRLLVSEETANFRIGLNGDIINNY